MPSLPSRRPRSLLPPPARALEERIRAGGRWAVLGAVDGTLAACDSALRSELASEVLARVSGSPLVDDVFDHVIRRALDSPEAERLVAQVVDSPVFETAVARLIENDGLWLLVEQIAQSPAVTAAISQQGVGFANQMAGVVREHSQSADDRLERLARRLSRRGRDEPGPAGERPALEP